MGPKSSKEQQPKAKIVTRKQGSTKQIRLLVLHKKSKEPDMEEFCDAFNSYPSTDNIDLHHGDIKIAKVQDDGSIPESEKNDITSWISDWHGQGRIVLICLLTDFDIGSLIKNENNRIIVFCFKNPPVKYGQHCICTDADFESGNILSDELSKLVNKIRADGQ